MRILLLPGGSSPFSSEKYRRSYSDIVAGLKQMNPSANVELLRYPGQVDEMGLGIGELTIGCAAESVLETIQSGDQTDVRMICICFGCIVGANVIRKAQSTISRVCFYGPLPYWTLASKDFLDEPTWTNSARGVIATRSIADGGVPFEDYVCNETDMRVKVAVGSNDDVVIPATLEYYRALLRRNRFAEFSLIPDAPHTVSEAMCGWNGFSEQCLKWIAETNS